MQSRLTGGMPAKLSQGPRTGYDLSRMGAGAARGFNGKKKLVAAPWSGTWPAPGATLDLDFANNRGFVRGSGAGGVMDGITFTRASNGNYINEQGLLVGGGTGNQVGANLLAFPQDFDNAAWLTTSAGSSSLIQNKKQQNPFGIPDATAISESNQYGQFFLAVGNSFSFNSPLVYTRSVFVKYNGARYISLGVNSDTATQLGNCNVLFDLVDKVVVSSEIGPNAVLYGSNVEDYGNGWLRLSITSASSTVTNSFHLAFHKTASISWGASSRYQIPGYTGDGTSGIYIWGAQLELGSTVTEYFPTNINVPRFDWASTEQVAQRNLLRFTETFAWSGLAASITQGQLDPDGGTTAVLLSSTGTTSYLYQTVSLVVGEKYTFYIYAKENQSSTVALTVFGINHRATFNLSEGGSFTGYLGTSFSDAQIKPVGSGWFLCSAVLTASATAVNVGVGNYSASAISALYLWHPQLEAGDTATDYQAVAQPTTNTPLRPTPTCNGLLIEEARTNRLLWCRDATQTQWAKTDITVAKDQTGIDGVANAASSLTATADGGTCIQTITLASGSQTGSVYLKRLTGTGIVQASLDGSTWSTVDLSDTEWRRIVLSGTVTNPVVGVRLAVSGDAVAMDYGQVEDGTFATSPILTTGASATRSADVAGMQDGALFGWYNLSGGTFASTSQLPPFSAAGSVIYTVAALDNVNRFYVWRNSSTNIRADSAASPGGASAINIPFSLSSDGALRTAFRVKNHNFALANGNTVLASSNSTINQSMRALLLGRAFNGGSYLNACISRLTFSSAAYSDAAARELST